MATPTVLTWKGVTDASLGVVTRSMKFIQAGHRYEVSQVEGRDGSDYTLLGRESYILKVDIELMPTANIDNVMAWLSGTGTLVRADDPLKYVTAVILSSIEYSKIQSTKQATVEFFVPDPYRYLLSESVQTVVSTPATIVNSGTAIAYPLLKVTGSGTVVLTLNGVAMEYVFPSGESEVYIDCGSRDYVNSKMIQDAYYLTIASLRNRALTITGNVFPSLSVGNNTLTLDSGSITSVEVTKRSRFL